MGRYSFHVIDADGHGGEETNWQDRVPERMQPLVTQCIPSMVLQP